MTSSLRLTIVVVANLAIIFAIFGYAIVNDVDLSQRLIDLSSSPKDMRFLCVLAGGMLVGLVANAIIFSYRRVSRLEELLQKHNISVPKSSR